MEAIAKLNNCPMSPRKMRLVVDQIRGQRVEEALNTLKYSQKRVYAEKVEKLLKSAGAEVLQFVRYEVGEGIEKKEDDFVGEVMAQAGKKDD